MTARFQTLHDLYTHATKTHAARPLFGIKRDGAWTWTTYAAFGDAVERVRAALATRGVGKGDRVAMIADNRVEWAVAAYATYGLGAQFVPMYEAQLAEDWVYILRDCGARVLFAAHPGIVGKLADARDQLPDLEHDLVLDGDATRPSDWPALLEATPDVPLAAIGPDDVAGFIYTSGTTGKPKGVLLTHGNLASNVTAIHQVLTMTPEDRSLSFLPWAHSFGQTAELHCMLSMGASMALAESVPKIVDNLGEVKPTLLVAVPRIFNRIYDGLQRRMDEAGGLQKWMFDRALANARRRRSLAEQGGSSTLVELKHAVFDRLVFAKVRERFGGRLKYAVSGGAALSPRVAEFIDDMGIVALEGYGLTETSPVVAVNVPGAHRIGTVGKPLPGVRVVVDHEATGSATDGEIVVYGPNVMKGYYGLPDENERVFTEDGGFRTGDMGRLDAEGFLSITGRIKEQYKLENGKYVVPSPLEEKLKLAPLIANALVFGANRPFNVALVVPDWEVASRWARDQGRPTDPMTLVNDARLREAIEQQAGVQLEDAKHYEQPRRYTLVADDFTTENGMLTPSLKVKRRVVIERYGEQLEQLYA